MTVIYAVTDCDRLQTLNYPAPKGLGSVLIGSVEILELSTTTLTSMGINFQ